MNPRKKPVLNTALAEAVREFASPTTPQQLEKRGVQRVRYVSIDRISEMIEKAVNRTILERTIGSTPGELGEFVDHAQAGLLGLLKGVQEVEASRGALLRSRTELMGELEEMRRDRGDAGAPHAIDRDDPTVQKMVAAIRESFGKLGARSPHSMKVEDELTEQALVLLEEGRRRAVAAQIRESDGHIDRLERRVTKLVESLEATEANLRHVAAMKNVDLGIASLYKVVQGLGTDEPNRELKQQLMEMIFKANVELQQKREATA